MEITLDLLLSSRDNRWAHQQELLRLHPELTLVCLTVIMPGKVKRNDQSLMIAHAATEATKKAFAGNLSFSEEKDLETGYEAYFLVSTPLCDTKRCVCDIEERHPLGRLFDLDVIRPDGTPVSRAEIGLQPRRCIICGKEVRLCIREHSHTQEELHTHIKQIVNNYVHRV